MAALSAQLSQSNQATDESGPGLTAAAHGRSFFLKRLGFTVPAAYGRGLFLGIGKGLLPLQTPINVVVGAPIPCSKFDGDTRSAEGATRTASSGVGSMSSVLIWVLFCRPVPQARVLYSCACDLQPVRLCACYSPVVPPPCLASVKAHGRCLAPNPRLAYGYRCSVLARLSTPARRLTQWGFRDRAGQAAVDELHARYVKQVRELWDQYKDRFALQRMGTFRVVE